MTVIQIDRGKTEEYREIRGCRETERQKNRERDQEGQKERGTERKRDRVIERQKETAE